MEIDKAFYSEQAASTKYDERYKSGYMARPVPRKVIKFTEIFNNIKLPESGTVLDFGCGAGAYTAMLCDLLPGWEIHGTDISDKALEIAQNNNKRPLFYNAAQINEHQKAYDLVFSNHVLEHVQNIAATFTLFSEVCKENAFMIHGLPCGNPGSFEHFLCSLYEDGVEEKNDNRFFFEDPAHLRRLDTLSINKLARDVDFTCIDEYYVNQYFGGINWISRTSPNTMHNILNIKKARGIKNKLIVLKYLLIAKTYSYLNREAIRKVSRRLGTDPLLSIEKKSWDEWHKRKKEKNGSEMIMVYKRGA